MLRHGIRFTLLLALLTGCAPASAAEITLRLASGPSGNHKYYHRLLEEALTAAGHTVTIVSAYDYPLPRIHAELEVGNITLHWMLGTPERDTKHLRIPVPLTFGLIGERVMLIPKGEEERYAKVKNLAQFKAVGTTAGFGKGWLDAAIWAANGLPYIELGGDWRRLYGMVAAKRDADYMPRGSTEIWAESLQYPALNIEPNLLLVYQQDFVFYVSKAAADLHPLIESALVKATKSGLQKRLINEYFGPSLQHLNIDKRIRIPLRNPE